MLENTLENKAKFFAQYLGQKIISTGDYDTNTYKVESYSLSLILKGNDTTKVLLNPVSSITDEDAIELYRNVLYKKAHYDCYNLTIKHEISQGKDLAISCLNIKGGYCGFSAGTGLFVSDYLRSKGYALPFMGLTVEKQIEYGWIKLKSAN